MAQYTLINPLQQVLTFEEYKKALKKAEAYMEKNQFSTEEKKPRGRPKGTTKKPQPTEPVEPKKRGRPPKAKPETPAPKAPVGRPAKKSDSFETIHEKDFDTEHFGTGWFENYDAISKTLNKFFKEPQNQFIRIQDKKLEIYDDDTWKPTPSTVIIRVLVEKLIEEHDSPADGMNLNVDRPQGRKNKERLAELVKQYLIERFKVV
jgi:hypothetical protein